jgi:hypothetical protein
MGEDYDQRVVFGLLLEHVTFQVRDNDVLRELAWPRGRLDAALAALERDGVVHRAKGFAALTPSAILTSKLLI